MRRFLLILFGISAFFGCMKMQSEGGEDSSKKGKFSFALEPQSYNEALKILEQVFPMESMPDESFSDTAAAKVVGFGTRFALDTSKYLLKIEDSKGNVYYDGLYMARPSTLEIPVGTYNISLRSGEFVEPSKDMPLFGQDLTVKAVADSVIKLNLISRQLTGGIRVKITEKFRSYFKGTHLYYIKDTAVYRQVYFGTYLYVFFYPGVVNVVYKNRDGSQNYTPPTKPQWADTVLLSRELKATDLVSIELDYDMTRANTGEFNITVDTVRKRYDNYFNLGFFAPYGSVSVVYAKTHIGDTVSLWGYIVGGNASSSSFSKKAPFTSKTHIVLAKEDWQSLRENVMAVELPNGSIRENLNLMDNPQLVKRKIVINGVIVDSYFGYPGLRSVSGYKLY